jgi:DNA repair exonuclease SbcCD nuclease subunit
LTPKLLVISDLHAHNRSVADEESPSCFTSDPSGKGRLRNPLIAISDALRNDSVSVDWLICPGDLGDRNHASSLEFSWSALHKLKKDLNAKLLFAAVGNHDINSRRDRPDEHPSHVLRQLVPKFPIISDSRSCEKFWTNDYFIKQYPKLKTTICLVNTCVFHGVASKDSEAEAYRGRLAQPTLDRLREELPKKLSLVNVLVMHHHIRQHPLIKEESYVYNGGELIEILKETGKRWLVIHGHQHLPDIQYADGSPNAPVILSAASVAAKPYPVNGRFPRNQMHLLEFDEEQCQRYDQELFGSVRSWSWAEGNGWSQASRGDGLPALCGFGCGQSPRILAENIIDVVKNTDGKPVKWNDLINQISELKFLTPPQFSSMVQFLEKKDVKLAFNNHHLPVWVHLEA